MQINEIFGELFIAVKMLPEMQMTRQVSIGTNLFG